MRQQAHPLQTLIGSAAVTCPALNQSLRPRLEAPESGAQPCGPVIVSAPRGRWVVPKRKMMRCYSLMLSHRAAEELNKQLGPGAQYSTRYTEGA